LGHLTFPPKEVGQQISTHGVNGDFNSEREGEGLMYGKPGIAIGL